MQEQLLPRSGQVAVVRIVAAVADNLAADTVVLRILAAAGLNQELVG